MNSNTYKRQNNELRVFRQSLQLSVTELTGGQRVSAGNPCLASCSAIFAVLLIDGEELKKSVFFFVYQTIKETQVSSYLLT